MTEELQKKAEDFIIDRYKIAECYREDNAETREYMRMDVHSQYEEEYQLYLDATKELEKENAELKAIVRNTKAIDESFALQTIQLSKAKEIIRAYKNICNYAPFLMELKDKAEQFISEVEK